MLRITLTTQDDAAPVAPAKTEAPETVPLERMVTRARTSPLPVSSEKQARTREL